MSERFPNPCCRCGFCCLGEQCPTSLLKYGEQNRCPALKFDGEIASYTMSPGTIPFGDGCCLSARYYKNGICYDFASLPKETKIALAQYVKQSP